MKTFNEEDKNYISSPARKFLAWLNEHERGLWEGLPEDRWAQAMNHHLHNGRRDNAYKHAFNRWILGE